MRRSRILWIFLVSIFFIYGCQEDERESIPDVSHIQMELNVQRFDQSVFQLDTNSMAESFDALDQKYPHLTSLYFDRVLALPSKTQEERLSNAKAYITNVNSRNLYDTVQLVYPKLDKIEDDLVKAFKYFKHYFPSFNAPHLYAIISDFGYQRFIFPDGEQDGVGIGLDMFLGENFPYKELDPQNPSFSDYLTRAFNQDHVAKKVIELILDDQMPQSPGIRLLDQMITNGKKLYLMDKILPFKNDTVVMEYSLKQLEWCKENELQMWSFFVDENLLYETNGQKINKYLNPAPTSPNMPAMAPGRTANYLGWQIVKAYMRKFPETTIMEMLQISDSQDFLEKSRYRPKR